MRKKWTEVENQVLRQQYANTSNSTLALGLNHSASAIQQQARKLNLSKSEAFLKDECGHFKKKHTPHNKGQKMPAEVYEKCKATMFKKGNMPHNTKYDGYERINKDGLIEVRISLGKFTPKQRLIWEQANGPIPEGCIITFKHNNTQNFMLENLQLISRAENMERNSIQRFPKELKRAIQVFSKLKKTLKTHESEHQTHD